MKRFSLFLHYLFILAVLLGICSSPSGAWAAYQPSLLQMEWQYGVYGSGIGLSRISVADIDADGSLEMIMGGTSGGSFGGNDFWYIVKKTGLDTYAQVWVSDRYPASISRIAVADADGDGIPEIYVGLSNGTVHVYNGHTLDEVGSFTAGGLITAMVVADVDGDGDLEIIITDGSRIYVYSALTYALKWESTAYGGADIAVGNVDSDAHVEIVTTTDGGHGYVIDGVTHVLKWDYVNGFGNIIRLADIDGDGINEIIGAARWYKITIFDADKKTPSREISVDLDISALQVSDTDGDGWPEILYMELQRGTIHCYDSFTLAHLWSIDSNYRSGSGDIVVGDVNNDGTLEIVWGVGAYDTGEDYLYIADAKTHQINWQSMDIDGPLSAVDVGDIDGDGKDEIVMVSFESNSGYDSGVIHIFDATTHDLKWRHTLDNSDWMGVRSVKIGDVDGDGNNEFVITTGNTYDGIIQVYDGKAHTVKRQSAGYSGNYFTALALGDVDGDGKTEIVAGQGREDTGAAGVYVVVFDGATMAEKWKSVDLGVYWGEVYDIKLADVDNDGHVEIIASVAGSRVYVFDGVTHQMKWAAAIPAYAVAVSDVDGDGRREILLGESNGVVEVYDGATFTLKGRHTLGAGNITGLLVDDINGDGTNEWIVSDSSTVYVYDGTTRELLWKKDNLAAAADYNHLVSRDIMGAGGKKIIFGSILALHQYEIGSAQITVTTSPAGLQVDVDGLPFTAAQIFTWLAGSSHTIGVSSPQNGGAGRQHVFSTWSDGGGQSHSVVTPGAPSTYTANFTIQYQLTTSVNPPGAGVVSPDCSGGCWLDGGNHNLSVTPDSGYVWSHWGGDCSGTGFSTTTLLNMPENCTANFTFCASQPVQISGMGYSSIQPAYDVAAGGDVLQILATGVTESPLLARNISVTLRGGYECGFALSDSYSFLQGSLVISQGTVTVENVIIR